MLFHRNQFFYVLMVSLFFLGANNLEARGGGGHEGGGHAGGGHARAVRGGEGRVQGHGDQARNFSEGRARAPAAQRAVNANNADRFNVRANPNFEVNPNRAAADRAIDQNVDRNINRDVRRDLNRDGYWGGYWGDGFYGDGLNNDAGDVPVTTDPEYDLEVDEDDASDDSDGGPTNNPDFDLEQDDDSQQTLDGSNNPVTGQPV